MGTVIKIVHHVVNSHLPELDNLPALLEQDHTGQVSRIPTTFPLVRDPTPVQAQIYFQPGLVPLSPEQAQVQIEGEVPGLEAGRHQE